MFVQYVTNNFPTLDGLLSFGFANYSEAPDGSVSQKHHPPLSTARVLEQHGGRIIHHELKCETPPAGDGRRYWVDQLGGKINLPNNQNNDGLQVAAAIRIEIAPTAHAKWRATFNGETLCIVAAPMVKAARILIGRGHDPACIVELWHIDAAEWALRGKLGAVAEVILDGERMAQRCARNRPPVRSVRKPAVSGRESVL